MKLREMTLEDLKDVDFDDGPLSDPGTAKVAIERGQAFVLEDEGKVKAAGGIVNLWSGVGEAWFALFPDCEISAITLVRECKYMINSVRSILGLHRIQATALADKNQHCRFLKLIGFNVEGLMSGYGPEGEDHVRYAMTWLN